MPRHRDTLPELPIHSPALDQSTSIVTLRSISATKDNGKTSLGLCLFAPQRADQQSFTGSTRTTSKILHWDVLVCRYPRDAAHPGGGRTRIYRITGIDASPISAPDTSETEACGPEVNQ